MSEGFTPDYFGERIENSPMTIQQTREQIVEACHNYLIEQFLAFICFVLIFLLLIYVYRYRKPILNKLSKIYENISFIYKKSSSIEKLLTLIVISLILLVILITILVIKLYG